MRLFLYLLLLVPIFTRAQQCRVNYIATVENTTCGGTVKVALASADTNCISQYWAVLYDSAGAVQARQNLSAAGKADFANLSSGTYNVKLEKKDGSDTHPTTLSVTVVSTYRRFSVDMTKATQTAATGECATDGKVALKIKDGSGPFVVKFYAPGATTPTFTSPATNKTGTETTVNITGLKPSTKYDIEVEDRAGGGTCSLTEPKNVRSITTQAASGSFIRNLTMETCRPLKTGQTVGANGVIALDVHTSGSYTIKVINKDTNEVLVNTRAVTATAGVVLNIEPDAGKKLEANKNYKVTIEGGGCTAERILINPYVYSPDYLNLHLVPSCANCNDYKVAISAHYNERMVESRYFPYKITIKVTRGGTTVFTNEFDKNDALPVSGTDTEGVLYGANKEFRFWNWWRPKVHTMTNLVKAGDVITVDYSDCNGETRNLTHTVTPPTNMPESTIKVLPNTTTATPCDKDVVISTKFQTYTGRVSYNAFCNITGLKSRVNLSGTWQTPTTGGDGLFTFFDEINGNVHEVKIHNTTATSYQVEYAEATGTLDGTNTKNCKHYLSKVFTQSNLSGFDTLSDIRHSVGGSVAGVLDISGRGNKFFLGHDNPQLAGLDFITDNNKLTVTIERADGQPNIQDVTVRGPWNLAGTYRYKFPWTKVFYPSMNLGNKNLYQMFDLPPGKYNVKLSDQCGSTRSFTIDINAINDVSFDIKEPKVTTDCAQSGQSSRGKVVFEASVDKLTTSGFWGMYVFKDLNNGQPIHKRVGSSAYKAIGIPATDGADPTRRYYKQEIKDLPPGKYILGITLGPCYHSVVPLDVADERGYMYHFQPTERRTGFICKTLIYKEFEIRGYSDVTPTVNIGMCDPSNPNTGMVRVELPAGSEPQYPITYTLYKVSGGTKAIATHSDGTQVAPVMVATRPANLEDAYATFSNIPRLSGSDSYEVKFESGCLDRLVPVPEFGSLQNPQVRTSAAMACAGTPLTLSVDLPASLYELEWKSSPATALSGVADKTRPSITLNPTVDAQYWVTYKMKPGFGCTPVSKDTAKKQVNLTRSNFAASDITGLSDKTGVLPVNQCAADVSWTAPTINDTAGCGYKLTWEVTKPDGSKYTPTPDANGNTPATSWNGFPVGESTVTYKVEGKIAGGTAATKSFKVTVTAPNINIQITSSFVANVGGTTALTSVAKGSTVYYKVTLKNTTATSISTGALRITLPDNTNTNYELPAANDPAIVTSQLGGTVNVSYDTGDPRVLILANITGGVLAQNAERSAYIPIKIKQDQGCDAYVNACQAILTAQPKLIYSVGGAGCVAENTIQGNGIAAEIDSRATCPREELYCGGSFTLTALGTGYTSYKWYSGKPDTGLTPLASTTSNQAVSSAGYYTVEKIATCSGIEAKTTEVIRLVDKSDTTVDPIRALAGNVGGVCATDNTKWQSHFYFCGGTGSKVLQVAYHQSGVKWQKEGSGCSNANQPNCYNTSAACWSTVSTDRSFTIGGTTPGKYRLQVGNGTCTREFYFEVFTTQLSGTLIGTPTPHTALSLGAANFEMGTHGVQYEYVATRSDGRTFTGDGPASGANMHKVDVTGLEVPNNRSQDTFRIVIKAKGGALNGCTFEQTVTINRLETMKAEVEYTGEWSTTECNKAKYNFTVYGGVRNYRYLIYKIDGQLAKTEYAGKIFEQLPDADFSSAITPTNAVGTVPDVFSSWIEVPREGKYIFLVRDHDDRYALTNEVQVSQASRYAVEVTKVDLTCATQHGGSISAKFLESNVPSPSVKLEKYKTDGTMDTSFPAQNNLAGQFNNLSAGKYRVTLSYLFNSGGGGRRCEIVRDIRIESPAPIEASIGVVSANNCDGNNGKFLLKVNWVKGGSGSYQFMSTSGTGSYSPDRTLLVDGGSQANPKVKVFVKDSNGCIAEFEVKAKKDLTKPTLAASTVDYDCGGNGTFTVTPTAPGGATYTYEYSLDGGVRQAPNLGNAMRYTGLAGRATPYLVRVYYTEPATESVNQLYNETFADMEDLDESDGAPTGVGSAKTTGILSAGVHVVTKQLPATPTTYRSLAGTGRYYAIHTAPSDNRLYVKDIQNVVPRAKATVKFKYVNLGNDANTEASVPLRVTLQVTNPGGSGTTAFVRTLPAAAQGGTWQSGEVTFEDLEGFNQHTQFRLIIEAGVNNAAVGLDEIEVIQPTKNCQSGEPISVQVEPSKGFGATITQVEPPKCHGGEGTLLVKLRNIKAGATFEYQLNSGAYRSTTLVGTDELKIPAPVTAPSDPAHTLKVRMVNPDGTLCEITAGGVEARINDVPALTIEEVKISPKGCIAPYMTARAIIRVAYGRTHSGTHPYTVQKKGPADADFVDVPTADVTWAGTTATVANLTDGVHYQFRIKDANECLSNIEQKFIPAKIDIDVTLTPTLCLQSGRTGEVMVQVNNGNGGYEFSKDGGTTWVSDPGNPTEYRFDGLNPASYTIKVKDALGCEFTQVVVIPQVMEVGLTSDDAFGCTTPQEQITIEAKGGAQISGGYTFTWKRGGVATDPSGYNPTTDTDGGNVLTNVTPGATVTYLVTIKTAGEYHFKVVDANGCEHIVSKEVKAETPAFLTNPGLSASMVACTGESTGVIGVFDGTAYLPITDAIDRTKGVAPYVIKIYKYATTPGSAETLQSSNTGRDLSKGWYKVELSDAKGCKTSVDLEIKEIEAPVLTLVRKKDISCTSGASSLGEIELSFTTGLQGNYYMALYTDSNYTTPAQNHAGTPQVTGENYVNSTGATKIFDHLPPGDYYPAITNMATGCKVTLPMVQIGGSQIKANAGAVQQVDCNTAKQKVAFFEDGAEIDENQLQVAIYRDGSLSSGLLTWISGTTGTIIGTGNNKKVEIEFTLLAKTPYRIAVQYKGCKTLLDGTFRPNITTSGVTITEKRKPNLCGAGATGSVTLHYELSAFAGSTAPKWELYTYPFDTRPGAQSPIATGTASTPSGGKSEIKQTVTGLTENKTYILVVRDGTAQNCVMDTKIFTVLRAAQPLAFVQTHLLRNSACLGSANETAQVKVTIKDGVGPYKYTISQASTEPTDTQWAHAAVLATNSRDVLLDKTFETTFGGKIKGTSAGTTWYVHVRDANDCHISQAVTVKEDPTPVATKAEVENPCVVGTEYTVKLTLSQIGKGQHYYTFKPAGGTEGPQLPIQFIQTGPSVWEGYIYRVYASSTARDITIYDQNGCKSTAVNFVFQGKISFDLTQSKPITCQPGVAGNGELKIDNIANHNPANPHIYRVLKEDAGGDIVIVNDTPMSGFGAFTVPITQPGRYRVEIVDTTHGGCPFSRTLTVNDKVLPILSLDNSTDSKCYNANQDLLDVNGGGSATLVAAPESQLPMSYSLKAARYADDNSAVTALATIPATHTNVTASNTYVDWQNNGRQVTFKGLLGDVRGIIYTVEAKAANGCTATTEFTIYGVKPIEIDMTQEAVTQFQCSGDQEVLAKLSLPKTAITGGSGRYRFTLLKGGTPVQGNIDLTEPTFTISDETGGNFTLRVEDAQYQCAEVTKPFPTAIKPFVKITTVTATEVTDITCRAGEDVKVEATLAPAGGDPIKVSLSLRSVTDSSHQTVQIIVPAGATTATHTFTNVPMGNYSVVATNDETGCVTYGTTYKVQDPNTFSLTATEEKPVKCYGGNDGSITFTLEDLDLENSGGVNQATQGYTLRIKSLTRPTDPIITVTVPAGSATHTLNTLAYGSYTAEAESTSTGCITKIPANFTIRQADQPINMAAKLRVPDDCSATGSAEISIDITGGIAPYKVTMTGDNGHTQTATQVYNRWLFTGVPGAAAPGATFTFQIEDAWGCVVTPTVNVNKVVKPDPIDFDDPEITMVSCKNERDGKVVVKNTRGGAVDDPTATTLTTTYYYELYHDIEGAIRPLQLSNEFTELPAGNYTLYVRDRWNCEKSVQFTLGTPPEIQVTRVSNSNLVCHGDTGKVSVSVTGGTQTPDPDAGGALAYIYSLELVEADRDVVVNRLDKIKTADFPKEIVGLRAGVNYRVRAMDGKRCAGESDLFSLTAAPKLDIKATYEDNCEDNEYQGYVVLTFEDATVDFTKVQYSFDNGVTKHSFAAGMTSGAQARISRTHSSVRPSSLPQSIKLYYSDAGTNCEGETSPVVIPVVEKLTLIKDPSRHADINELPLLGKNGVPDYTYYINGVHQGNNGTYIVRKQDPEGVDPSDNKLKKRIEARVEDSKGCTAEEVFYVEYYDIEIPRFFTPTGDGENDTWAPRNTQQYPNIQTLIFDRYGRLLKELSQGQSWDGTYNGKEMPTGDYWYIITLGEESDGREFKGHFTLYR
ncbi:T9SS type B sorting domain-containing protein [Capnocytophaga gingivalis]|uniref:T9SS type B sorting domain-containing protein n=1 Tax=Capnocytophaga gingivalis TaxID=1017 RepID=UPI003C6F3192